MAFHFFSSWAAVWAALACLPLALAVGGCRPAGRAAWAANTRALTPGRWTAWGSVGDPALLKRQELLAQYLSGVLAEGRGDLDGARTAYSQARSLDPESAQILLRLGAAHLGLNEFAAATTSFEEAARVAPADPRPRFLLGVLYTHQEKFEQAADQYAQVLNQDPGNLSALGQLADIYILQDRLEQALAMYEQLLQERPDSPVAHFNAGVLYARAEQWPQAVRHMAKAVELDPAYLEARMGLGVSLELSGELAQAKEQLLKALELEPMNVQLTHYLARVCYRLGELEESGEWITRSLSFRPRDVDLHLALAYLRIEQKRWADAVEIVRAAFGLHPEGPVAAELWTVLGGAFEAGEIFPTAKEAYRKALETAPGLPKPYLYLGALHHRLKEYEEAEKVFREGYERSPQDPNILNGLGYLYADWGRKLEEAVRLIERALAQDPENAAYLDSLGWAYYRMNRVEEALKLLEEAAGRAEDPEVLDHLGQVYFSLGKTGEAEAAWKKGLELSGDRSDLTERLKANIRALKRKGR